MQESDDEARTWRVPKVGHKSLVLSGKSYGTLYEYRYLISIGSMPRGQQPVI